MSTEQLSTSTKATHAIERGHFGRKVIDEAQRLYTEHWLHVRESGSTSTTPAGNPSPATFRAAAERIVTLEEAVRDRDRKLVEAHEETAHWRLEADGHAGDATYYEAKWRESTV